MLNLLIATVVALLLLSVTIPEAVYLPSIKMGPTATPTSTSIPGQEVTNTPTSTTVPGQEVTNTPTSTTVPGQEATATATPTNTPTTQVGNQTATPTATPTQTRTPSIPSPYNVQAKDIVLQLEDMPSGFQLNKSTALTLTNEAVAWGGVSGYVTQFSNEVEQIFMESKVIVFESQTGSSQAFAYAIDISEQAPGYTSVLVPTYGDESAAFVATYTINGQLMETYNVYSSLGNVFTGLHFQGLAEEVEVEDSTFYVQRMLEKLQ